MTQSVPGKEEDYDARNYSHGNKLLIVAAKPTTDLSFRLHHMLFDIRTQQDAGKKGMEGGQA